MYTCMYIYIYVCMYVCERMYVCIYIYIYIFCNVLMDGMEWNGMAGKGREGKGRNGIVDRPARWMDRYDTREGFVYLEDAPTSEIRSTSS